jgi:hypothetical protein
MKVPRLAHPIVQVHGIMGYSRLHVVGSVSAIRAIPLALTVESEDRCGGLWMYRLRPERPDGDQGVEAVP